MQKYEDNYAGIVREVMRKGETREGRNGVTKSLFGEILDFDLTNNRFPLIQYRKMFPKGVLGEFAAFIRKPKHIEDFERWGCNYWETWSDFAGNIHVDYGNAWFLDGQIDHLKECLKNNPTDRRMLVTGWRPSELKYLDLPCCHYAYQFYVREGKYLDMLWHQRSTDVMIGLPSDMILAALWIITLANEFGYEPGRCRMSLGDTHIYEEHFESVEKYLGHLMINTYDVPPMYTLHSEEGKPFEEFEPDDITIVCPQYGPKLDLELKA